MTTAVEIRRADAGFTLVELLVVLALLALAASMTTGFVRPRAGVVALRATALQIAAQLRLTRSFAMLNAREANAVFDLEHGRLTGDGLRQPFDLPTCAKATLTTAKLETPETKLAIVRFYADGTSSGGRIALACNGQSEALAVDWLTGGVTLEPRR